MWVLLIVLSVALTSLVSDPVQAQTATDVQYGSSSVGYNAATDALRASSAFDNAPDTKAADVEEGVAFAAEITSADSEEVPEIDSLPNTGGTSPLLLGVLLIASGALIRALTR